MPSTHLDHRGVVRVSGSDAATFLQGLVTNDVLNLPIGAWRYAALLTPQGKILFDFLILAQRDGFLLDCRRDSATDLAKRLGFYKLRAAVTITDESAQFGVRVGWDMAPPQGAMIDPRDARLGWRAIEPAQPGGDERDYEALRILLGVPEGGRDFAYGETFPHEANLDRLHGVDFKKGCYVGQEVVSRVEHRGLARRRIVRMKYAGEALEPGTAVLVGDQEIGTLGTSANGHCLALLRTDKLAANGGLAQAQGVELVEVAG